MRKHIHIIVSLIRVFLFISMVVSCEGLPIVEEENPVLPDSIVAGENGSLIFEVSSDSTSATNSYVLLQESVYVDPDGTSYKLSPKATVTLVTVRDTLVAENPSYLVPSDTSSAILASSFDEKTMTYLVQQQFNLGSQKIIVTMNSEEPVLENSLGQTVRLPFLKLVNASIENIEASLLDPSTRIIEITDTTYYKVKASYAITAELCNVEEEKTVYLDCSAEYVGVVAVTQLYPGQEFSYTLTDGDGNVVDYCAAYDILPDTDFVLNIEQLSSYKDNKKDVQEKLRAWTSVSVADTLHVTNSVEFLSLVESAVTIDCGYESSSEEMPYWELEEPVLIGYSIVDSLDIYPSDVMRRAARSPRRNDYSQEIVVVAEDDLEQNSRQPRKAQMKSTADDLHSKYPNVNDLICPERIYMAELTYIQKAVLRNSSMGNTMTFAYKANVVGKTNVELTDVQYDNDVEFGIFPTSSGGLAYTQLTFYRKRAYSTGNMLTDMFVGPRSSLFTLSTTYIAYQEFFNLGGGRWEDADTLDPHYPTILQVPYDDSPRYYYTPANGSDSKDVTLYRYYYWSIGLDWDVLYKTRLGEVNSAVGIPGIHRFDGIVLEDIFSNRGIEEYGMGEYETYVHSDTRENYDPSVNTPGWYTGYLQSRNFCREAIYNLIETSDVGRYIYVPRMQIDLCFNHKVLCIDDKIIAPKQVVDDTVVERTIEDAVSPTRGPVKIVKMGLDFTVYDEVYKFRLTDTLYNYYSPHYDWAE